MTKTESKTGRAAVKDILLSNPDGLQEVIRAVMQEVLEAEVEEALGASKGNAHRSGWAIARAITGAPLSPVSASSSCGSHRTVPAASPPSCSSATSAPERALVATLAEMYVQGVSTRKVKAITEELCGHAFSASFDLGHQQAA